MRTGKRIGIILILLILCFWTGTGTAENGASPRPPQEEYGSELKRGILVVRADTSTSRVRDWRRAKTAEVGEFTGETAEIIYKQTRITDGYHEGDPMNLSMRILYDRNRVTPSPVILFIPGGGFMSSVMRSLEFYYTFFAVRGYVTAVIEYRTIGQGRYTDGVADVRDAVRWLRAHAKEYGIAPERIGLFGASAGSHMAALACTAPDLDCFRGEDNLSMSYAVQAVACLYGTSDLTRVAADMDRETQRLHTLPRACEAQYVNGALSGKGILDDPEEAARANPVNYVNGSEPPFLHIHGDEDNLVSPSGSLLLHNTLLEHGASSVRYSLRGENHGTAGFYSEPAMHLLYEFFREYLRREHAPIQR